MEGPIHWQGKARLEKILLESGWSIYLHDGDDFFEVETPLGTRTYWPDALAWKDGEGWVCFEVDGRKGHSTRKDFQKMNLRDSSFVGIDIRTVRIKNHDLQGRHRRDDSLILEEIAWQLS